MLSRFFLGNAGRMRGGLRGKVVSVSVNNTYTINNKNTTAILSFIDKTIKSQEYEMACTIDSLIVIGTIN